jgi:hypothetical protein
MVHFRNGWLRLLIPVSFGFLMCEARRTTYRQRIKRRKELQCTLIQEEVCTTYLSKTSFFNFIIFTSTHMCIDCLVHKQWTKHIFPSVPPHCFWEEPVVPPSYSLIFWRENIRDNNKDIEFLLVWDKDIYTERFLALLPCTCILQPRLVYLYQTSSLLSGPLPIVVSASLRLLYLLLYSEHINHIEVLGFLPFPYSSHACSPFSVWPRSNNIIAFKNLLFFW